MRTIAGQVILALALFVAGIATPNTNRMAVNPTTHQHHISQQQNHFVDLNSETRSPSPEKPVPHFITVPELNRSTHAIPIPIHFGMQSFESAFLLSSLLIRTLYTASQL